MKVFQLKALQDNYIYVLTGGGQTIVVDPTKAAPVLELLKQENLKLDYIINTHHHPDHVGGNLELKAATGAKVIAYKGDAHRIPGIDTEIEEGDVINLCGQDALVMFIPGHTLGHIAYYFAALSKLFSGDTVFSMGCGRLFEGTPQQMFTSIDKIKRLPPDTVIYCAHEYTQSNGSFALSLFPDNEHIKARMAEVMDLRAKEQATVPTRLSQEIRTNPFLIARDVNEFAKYRTMKDKF